MNTKDQFVITINRELGSGGRTVGEILSQKLGVPFYDKAVIKALKEKYNLNTETIEQLKGRSHTWWAEFKRAIIVGQNMANATEFYLPLNYSDPNLITTDEVFETESEILQGIAAEESCVIAGRSGFFVLKDHPNRFSVLIQASPEYRIARVMEKQNIGREEAVKAIEKVDQMRENYVKKYAHTSRYDARNYDLVIKMDGKTEDQIADLIYNFIKG